MLCQCLLFATFIVGVLSRSIGHYARVVNTETASNTSYDFVIIGGGIAGLTVADRLTENLNTTVLVVEYGPFDKGEDSVLVPGDYFPVPYLWLPFESTPQRALNNAVYTVPCGRVVGGGSAVNAMFFHRASAVDYHAWDELGATGWSWDDLFPYFKKSETFTPPDLAFAEEHNITWDESVHGHSGPVQASYSPYDYPGDKNFWDATLDVGISPAEEPNGGDATGLFWLLRALDPVTRTRSYARIAHYDRVIRSRPNYHLLAQTAGTKVLFDGTTATGIQFMNLTSGVTSTAIAKKEVIIAAGASHTPQILQLSGIGPKSLLEGLGIDTVVDLPGVGSNLQDHLVLTVTYNYTSNLFPNGGSLDTNATYNTEQLALYNSSRLGAYTLTRGTGNLFVQLPLKNATDDYDSIISLAESQDPASLLPSNTDPTVIAGYTAQREVIISELFDSYEAPIGDISWNTGPSTVIYMIRPLSRGSVTINSTNPLDAPLVDFGAATDPTDLELLLAMFRKNRDIMNSGAMQALGPIETSPGQNITSDDDLKASFRATLQPTNAHMCCTAPMMEREMGGVVDPELRVYGVQGLSIVDASIWPLTPGAGPQPSVYGSGEKAADIIKIRHGLKR